MKALFDSTEKTKWYVTEKAEVYGFRNGKLYKKKPSVHSRGYVYVRTINGNYQLHRLVASSFLDNKDNKPCVNHRDGNKQNNNVNNLEWVTHRENAQHSIKMGLTRQMGKNEGNIKYSNDVCKDVLKRVKKGMSYTKAGEKYNMPYSTVAHLVRGSRRLIL